MEEQSLVNSIATPSSLIESVDSQRRRARQLFNSERQRVHDVEASLVEQLGTLAAEMSALEADVAHRETDLVRREAELADQAVRLEQQQVELQQRRQKYEEEFSQFNASRHTLFASLEQSLRQVTESQNRLDACAASVAARQEQLEQWRQTLATQSSQLDRRQAELDEQAAAVAAREAELARAAADGKPQVEPRTEALHLLREQMARWAAEQESQTDQANELAELKAERRQLLDQIEALEQRCREAAGADADGEAFSQTQRRFELAVEEIRELKARNAQLEGAGNSSPHETATPAAGFDWETQKRRMIAELEAGGDSNPLADQQRMTIEGTIQITDQVIAEKDGQIQELQRRLAKLSPAPSSEPAKREQVEIEAVLDKDEAIRQEREKLQQLQTEWREKLRQAEVDISLERAKLARERTELEERLHEIRSRRKESPESAERPRDIPEKSARGRWLSRLGLARDDE